MLSHPSALAGFRPPDCPRFVREDLPERSYNESEGELAAKPPRATTLLQEGIA